MPTLEEIEQCGRELGATLAKTPVGTSTFTRMDVHRIAVVVGFAYLGAESDVDLNVPFQVAFVEAFMGTQRALELARKPETER